MSIKEHWEFFLHPDRTPIKKKIYRSIVKASEELEVAQIEGGNPLKVSMANLKLYYHNMEGVFDYITREEAVIAMRIGIHRARARSKNKR